MTRALLVALLAGCSGEISGGSADDPGGAGAPDRHPSAGEVDPGDPCAAAGVDAIGRCDGTGAVLRCENHVVVRDSCPDDERCLDVAGAPVCLTSGEACAGVGPQGRCEGHELVSCDDGWPTRSDCAEGGLVCDYLSDADGYGCADPAVVGASAVRGIVEYEDRALSPGQLGPPEPAAARGVKVYLIRESDDEVVASATTADDGSYVIHHGEIDGTRLRVTAATYSAVAVRPLKVQRASGNSHGFRSAAFDAAPAVTADILVTEASDAAPAFNIFDRLIHAMDETRRLGASRIAPLTAEWQRGTAGGSYYQGGSNYLHLGSGDGYDDVVILHEFGHYHQDEYGASDSPGGPHPSNGGDDPRLAWGEGEATYLATALRGVPYYIDYDSDGGWYVELEERIHGADMSRGMSQYIYEWMVAQLMWDVGDDGLDTDGDPVTGHHDDAWQVTTTYLTGSFTDRGARGVDLVDWIDGWLLRTSAADCDSLRELVHDWYGFPYDFASCP